MTKGEYRRACVEVGVMADVLALWVRSHCPPTPAAKQLEIDVEIVASRFARIAKAAITTPAQRAMYRRNWKRLAKVRRTEGEQG